MTMSAFEDSKRTREDIDDEVSWPKRHRTTHSDYHGASNDRQHQNPTRLSHDDYQVGWICALHIEIAAAQAMLDELHVCLPKNPNDCNTYTFGSIGQHNIVIACLPTDRYDTNNAAPVASNMSRSFPSIRTRLMVGIGGGVPGKTDMRLGDIVVGNKVVQYDIGKIVRDGHFQRTGIPYKPPLELMTAVAKLRADHELKPSKIPSILADMLDRHPSMTKYTHRGPLQDCLFDNTYDHDESMDSCVECDRSKLVERQVRSHNNPKIYYGLIASGNQDMKHGETRDRLAQVSDIRCFEMEAAGLMDNFPCLVIRGICDYSDSHKNKQWQEYAAATAAAYAKELLSVIPPQDIQKISTVTQSSDNSKYCNLHSGYGLLMSFQGRRHCKIAGKL